MPTWCALGFVLPDVSFAALFTRCFPQFALNVYEQSLGGLDSRRRHSSAAFICMNLAQYAPELVPLDILERLSVHDEDWYVQAPANAALKAMIRSIPATLHIS